MHQMIRRTLLETGLPWRVVPGKGHQKIELAGRLVGVLHSKSTDSDRRATLNIRAQIRRAAKEMKE